MSLLAAHHSWNPLEIPSVIRSQLQPSKMTWFCRRCEVQNSHNLEKCKACWRHWSEVWEPSKRKARSRSKSKKEAQAQPSKESAEESWQVFPAKVPWITSTPGRMVSTKTEVAGDAMEGELSLPPQPVLPPPPKVPSDMEESLSSEEIKILEHLRGLQSMGMELSESMEQQLQLLATKENKMNSTKVLSHGHLNKYKKLKGQVATSAKRIKELDTEWNAFVSRTMAKIKEHGLMYQRCRSDMLEQYNQKLAELHSIKEEVSVASRSLIGQPDMEEGLEDAPDLEGGLAEVRTTLADLGTVDLTDGPMEDEEMLADFQDAKDSEPKKEPLALKPFRSAASPSGVAKNHLKPRSDKHAKETKYREDK